MTVKVGMTRSRSYEIDPEEWKETKWTDEVHYDEQESNVSITFYSGCSPSSKGITLVAGTVEGDLLQYWGEIVYDVPNLSVAVHRILAEIADFLDIHPRHLLPLERKVIDDLPANVIKELGGRMSEEQQKESVWEEQVFETLMDPDPDSFLGKRIPWTPPSTAPINPSVNPTALLDSLDRLDEIVEKFKEINISMSYPMPSWCVGVEDCNIPLVIRAVLKAYAEVYAKP